MQQWCGLSVHAIKEAIFDMPLHREFTVPVTQGWLRRVRTGKPTDAHKRGGEISAPEKSKFDSLARAWRCAAHRRAQTTRLPLGCLEHPWGHSKSLFSGAPISKKRQTPRYTDVGASASNHVVEIAQWIGPTCCMRAHCTA